jgi:hypothetical protein
MNFISLLATVEEQAAPATRPLLDVVAAKEYLWNQISTMYWLTALLILSVGVVYLLYGWRIFRVLVVISFGFIGMFLGMIAGDKAFVSEHALLFGGVIGMGIFAVIAIPLMKWCVSILGAIAGGILTSGIWLAFDLSDSYLFAGFLVGFITGGLISFIMLKVSVMLFTSFGGSLIVVSGVLALLHEYDTKVANPTTTIAYDLIFVNNWILPTFLVVITMIGMYLQNKFIKQAPKFEI